MRLSAALQGHLDWPARSDPEVVHLTDNGRRYVAIRLADQGLTITAVLHDPEKFIRELREVQEWVTTG